MKCQQSKPCDNEALPSTVIYRPSTDSATRICGPCLESRLAGRISPPSRPPGSASPCKHAGFYRDKAGVLRCSTCETPPCEHCRTIHDPQSHCPIDINRRRAGLRPVDCLGAIIALEAGELTDEDDVYDLFQALINNGQAWTLQGFYGRAAADLIRSGRCVDTHGVLNHD